ncbi:MAG TPA: nucleotidyltransferase family protein [Armatimonadota bacterium]|jgi:hypothetical protein
MPTPLKIEVSVLISSCYLGEEPPALPPGLPDHHLLLRLAVFHRVASLVHENAKRLDLSADSAEAFKAAAMATLHRNLQFAAELKIALAALAAANVPVILLKGAQLMDAVYHNLALRPLSDLDLLVQPQDASQAVHALRDAGYVPDARKAAFGLAADREIRLDKSGVHDVTIELHTDLNRPTRHHWFPVDEFWERSEEYPFEGVPARALSPADNMAFLCAHAVPHAFSQLIWLRDIAGLLPMVPGGFAETAHRSRARRAVFAGVWLASTLLGAKVDEEELRQLGGADARAMQTWLTPERIYGSTHYSTVDSLKFRAALSDTAADAASIVGAGAVRRVGEFRRGLSSKKQI